jgi:hypothetical protein
MAVDWLGAIRARFGQTADARCAAQEAACIGADVRPSIFLQAIWASDDHLATPAMAALGRQASIRRRLRARGVCRPCGHGSHLLRWTTTRVPPMNRRDAVSALVALGALPPATAALPTGIVLRADDLIQ